MQSLRRAGRLLRQLSIQAEAMATAAAPAGRLMPVCAAEANALASASSMHMPGGAGCWSHGSGGGAGPHPFARSFGSISLERDDADSVREYSSSTLDGGDAGGAAAGAEPSSALDPQAIADACGAAEFDALAAAGEVAWLPTRGLQNLLGHMHLGLDLPW